MVDGMYAVRQFRDTGDARRLAKQLDRLSRAQWRHQEGSAEFSRFTSTLKRLSTAMVSGLPLETGIMSRETIDQVESSLEHLSENEFVAKDLIKNLQSSITDFSVSVGVAGKQDIKLNSFELRRELSIIKYTYESQAFDKALLLLREWIINCCLLASKNVENWLEYGRARKWVERSINHLEKRFDHSPDSLTENSRKLIQIWRDTRSYRNLFAHAGMSTEEVSPSTVAGGLRDIIDSCENHLGDLRFWKLELQTTPKHLLLSPLGLSPGVLYSAIKQVKPDDVIVICSEESCKDLRDICRITDFDEKSVTSYVVEDVFSCFNQARHFSEKVREDLFNASLVTINMTGGTTGMQYLVEKIGRDAASVGVRIRRVALCDARSPEEQKRNPYVLGELIELS
jgi:hypothetical protein